MQILIDLGMFFLMIALIPQIVGASRDESLRYYAHR